TLSGQSVPGYDMSQLDSVVVRKWIDDEGRVDSLRRHIWPSQNGILDLTTRWLYDALGRKTRETAPDGAYDTFIYGDGANLTYTANRAGAITTLAYDALSRLVSNTLQPTVTTDVAFPGSSLLVPQQVDSFAYDAAGRMTRAWNTNADITREYTLGGLLKKELQSVASAN